MIDTEGRFFLHREGDDTMASRSDRNILVVDDDVFIRKIVQDRLKMEGYTVTTAEDGKAGWEKFLENTYQLIITDINMPKINGIELLNKILATKIKVPTVVMSGGLSKAMESLVKETGARAFLRKPFSIRDLVNVVSSNLNREDNDKNESTERTERNLNEFTMKDRKDRSLRYKKREIGKHRIDYLIENQVIVES